DGKLVFMTLGSTAIVWDAASGKKLRTIQGEGGPHFFTQVAVSGDGKLALTGPVGSLWDTTGGQKIHTLYKRRIHRVYGVARSDEGKLALTGSGREAMLWGAAGGKKLHSGSFSERVRSVALSSDGKIAVAESGDSRASLWDTDSGKE